MFSQLSWSWPGVKSCGGDNVQLKINEACLEVTSSLLLPVHLASQSTECRGCDLVRRGTIPPNSTKTFVVDSSYPLNLQLDSVVDCNVTKWFDDFGLYSWAINENDSESCGSITVKEEPEHFWLNVAAVTSVCVTLAVIYKLSCCVKNSNWLKRLRNRNASFEELQEDIPEVGSRERNEARTRRLSRVATIDVFRGFAITLMVFVNYGGGQYSVLKHAPWNGLTVADIVFPFFIWIMGVSTVISLRSHLRASIYRKEIFFRIVRRSAVLVSLGIILNSGKGSDTPLRIPGVLQRIGLTYFIVACTELFFSKPQRSDQYGPWNMCMELADATLQWAIVALLTALHLALTFALPVPGCPSGYLGPGGLADRSEFTNCTGGAAGYIDRLVFTEQHIYQRPTSQKIYHSQVPYDPEGILGLFTSVLMAYLGVHCGRIILSYEHTRSRIRRWLLWSVLTGVLAGCLCSWSKDEGLIPVNKNLWSLSFVLATSSMAFFLFSVLYLVVDEFRVWGGAPFVYAGMNSIVIYLGHEIMNKQLPWRWTPLTTTHAELLVMDVSATLFWLLVSYVMYINNVFISL